MKLLALTVALGGCTHLLGLGDPTLAGPDADPAAPSCETGWQFRVPVELVNDGPTELHDYQVRIDLDTGTEIANQRLQRDGDDLRFAIDGVPVAHLVESGLGTSVTTVWIAVPTIPVGTSQLDLFYGNPNAGSPPTAAVFVPDVIANPSFEVAGGWTAEPAMGPPANFVMPNSGWSSDGTFSLLVDEEVRGERLMTSRSSISQPVTFPAGSEYVIRFDIDVVAASNGGINGTDNGSFAIASGNGIDSLWMLTGDRGNITGAHLNQETGAVSAGSVPLSFVVSVAAGDGAGYAKGFLDHLRVRKHATPEPVARLGIEQPACP